MALDKWVLAHQSAQMVLQPVNFPMLGMCLKYWNIDSNPFTKHLEIGIASVGHNSVGMNFSWQNYVFV